MAGWGSSPGTLDVTLVEPELVEVGVDVARDASGRWRHLHRARPDLSTADIPRMTVPPR